MKSLSVRGSVGMLTVLCLSILSLAIYPALAAKAPSKPAKPAPATAAVTQPPGQPLDIIVKINRFEDALSIVDQLYGAAQKDPAQSPTMMLRGMLQGTAWIDASRPIVIGIEIREPKPAIAAMVPFVEPNPSFMASFGAQPGPGYYLLSLPPGQPLALSENSLKALTNALQRPGNMTVNVDVALGRILKTRDRQIRESIMKMESLPDSEKMSKTGLSPEKIQSMIDTASQIQTMKLGVNLDRNEISTLFEMIAERGTPLSRVVAKSDTQTSLKGYSPAHHVNFKSRAYNIQGLMDLFLSAFGGLYQEMGFDVKGMRGLLAQFTGEMAGGMSYGPGGMSFEMIALMKDAAKSADFIEKTYLPWLENYGRSMEKMFEKQHGTKIGPMWVRTRTSQVEGHRVVGEKFQMPMMPGIESTLDALMNYEVRLAMVGDKFIVAPDDTRMAALIKTAKTMKKAPASGPLMTGDIDMGSYLGGILGMMPDMEQVVGTLPKTGRITFTADIENGRAFARTAIPTQDISTFVAYFAHLGAATKKIKDEQLIEKKTDAKGEDEKKMAPLNPEQDPGYWIEKGALAATYGADRSAINYFEKALTLDPQRSDAWFQMGISYGELREYTEAIAAIEKAIALNPKRGLYYYGRGRVFLLSGETSLAVEDFQIAADLGSEDAIRYLELTAYHEAE